MRTWSFKKSVQFRWRQALAMWNQGNREVKYCRASVEGGGEVGARLSAAQQQLTRNVKSMKHEVKFVAYEKRMDQ